MSSDAVLAGVVILNCIGQLLMLVIIYNYRKRFLKNTPKRIIQLKNGFGRFFAIATLFFFDIAVSLLVKNTPYCQNSNLTLLNQTYVSNVSENWWKFFFHCGISIAQILFLFKNSSKYKNNDTGKIFWTTLALFASEYILTILCALFVKCEAYYLPLVAMYIDLLEADLTDDENRELLARPSDVSSEES